MSDTLSIQTTTATTQIISQGAQLFTASGDSPSIVFSKQKLITFADGSIVTQNAGSVSATLTTDTAETTFTSGGVTYTYTQAFAILADLFAARVAAES
jgi:hypothetical protein